MPHTTPYEAAATMTPPVASSATRRPFHRGHTQFHCDHAGTARMWCFARTITWPYSSAAAPEMIAPTPVPTSVPPVPNSLEHANADVIAARAAIPSRRILPVCSSSATRYDYLIASADAAWPQRRRRRTAAAGGAELLRVTAGCEHPGSKGGITQTRRRCGCTQDRRT